MSYRNDHDAALLRVDALESELETLRIALETQRAKDEAAGTPPPKASKRAAWIAGIALVGTAFAGAFTWIGVLRHDDEPEVPVATAVAEPDDLPALRACRNAIRALAAPLDADMTDPRGPTHASVKPIIATGAGCRELLDRWDTLAIDPDVRVQIGAWKRTEDELLTAITRTVAYYESDPYAKDSYRSGPQLWSEYDRAIVMRNSVLAPLDQDL